VLINKQQENMNSEYSVISEKNLSFESFPSFKREPLCESKFYDRNQSSNINENKLLFNGREIKINTNSKEFFLKNLKYLKCLKCSNYLISAKTCRACLLTFCRECISKSTICPNEDCESKLFEETLMNKTIRIKLCKVKLNCEKDCGCDENVSIFSYIDHINNCKGIFSI